MPRPSPALVQFLVEAGGAAAAAARHRPTVPRPNLLLSWQGFIASPPPSPTLPYPLALELTPMPMCMTRPPATSVSSNRHPRSRGRASSTRMQGLTTTGSRATQSPQKVLKVAEDRPSTPPCRPVFVAPRATCPACPLRRGRRSEIRPQRNLTAAAPPFPQRGSTHSHKHTSGNSVCIAGPLRTIVDRRLSVRLPGAAPPPPGLSGLTPPWRNNLASARTGGKSTSFVAAGTPAPP